MNVPANFAFAAEIFGHRVECAFGASASAYTTGKTEDRTGRGRRRDKVRRGPGRRAVSVLPERREENENEINIHIITFHSVRTQETQYKTDRKSGRRDGGKQGYGLPVGAARHFLANRFDCKQ